MPGDPARDVTNRKILRVLNAVGSMALAAAVLFLRARHHDVGKLLYSLHYVVPMIIFAAALVDDRLAHGQQLRAAGTALDAAVILIAASRLLTSRFPYSGHMVLLVYGLMTACGRPMRILAVVLLIHATALKLLAWHDPVTWSIGAVMGYLFARFHKRSAPGQAPTVSA